MTAEASEPRIGLLASEEPPQHGTGVTQAVLDLLPALREQSGTWFRVGEFPDPLGAKNAAGHLRKNKRTKDFEFATRQVTSGEDVKGSVLWARHHRAAGVLRSVS